MNRLAIVVLVAACGSKAPKEQEAISNQPAPAALADAAPLPPNGLARLPPNPTQDDFTRVLAAIREEMAVAQQAVADAVTEDDGRIAHEKLSRLIEERAQIEKLRRETFQTVCDPADRLCSP